MKFKRNKKVFVVDYVKEVAVCGRIVNRNIGGLVCVRLADGTLFDYPPCDIFSLRRYAERKAEEVRAEHEQLWREVMEDAAQAYYQDVLEQRLCEA